jgi:hypothetical protein
MSNYVLALIVGGASLPYIVRLICCGMALWLSRNDVQLRDQLFKTMLTLIARGPSKYDFAIRAIEAWKQFRPANESPPAGTPPLTDRSREGSAQRQRHRTLGEGRGGRRKAPLGSPIRRQSVKAAEGVQIKQGASRRP